MIKVSLSLIGQEVKIVSPKIRLHLDMICTIVSICGKYQVNQVENERVQGISLLGPFLKSLRAVTPK